MSFRLVGVIDEDPFSPLTWSGLSAYFFKALRDRGALLGAVDAMPARAAMRWHQLLAFSPDRRRWRFKYHLSPGMFRARTGVARRHLSRYSASDYEVVLQVGAWYDLTGHTDKPVVSYHDGCLAARIASPFGYPRVRASYLRRALRLERELYARLSLIFPMSRWLADCFIRDNLVDPRKVFPIGAGVNLPKVRDTNGKSYDAPRLLFVGRDFERKGGASLLEAFALVRRQVPEAELTIVGPALGSVPPGVRCLGPLPRTSNDAVERLLDEYARASIFVLPSLYEPFGVVFGEAMAHRLPCVGTRTCAMPEIIDEGETGFTVPTGDAEALADRLTTLLESPSLCREMGERGRRKYLETLTWEKVAGRMCDVIGVELKLR